MRGILPKLNKTTQMLGTLLALLLAVHCVGCENQIGDNFPENYSGVESELLSTEDDVDDFDNLMDFAPSGEIIDQCLQKCPDQVGDLVIKIYLLASTNIFFCNNVKAPKVKVQKSRSRI